MHAQSSTLLILTLRLDERSATYFNDLRRRHFPPERNHLAAHVTLFHKLPGDEQPNLERDIAEEVEGLAPFAVRVAGLRSLGRGVAFQLEAQEAVALRKALARRWKGWLSPQDAQNIAPHVTVQNKVNPEQARALLEDLSAGFEPFEAQGEGLDLWAYRGGPWEFLRGFSFASRS